MVFSTYRDGPTPRRNHRGSRLTARLLAFTVSVAAALGCGKDPAPERRAPPPKQPTTCDGDKRINDPNNLKYFPANAGAFCIDPNGSDKGFGVGAQHPIEGICDLFDGECDIYRGFDVEHVVEARYVDGGGSGATIDVKLSKFGSTDLSYAMFTKRVVGDGDPAHPDTPKPIESQGAAALGWGNAYLWRGPFLAEITYNDPGSASEDQIKAKADALLPPLVKAFGDKLVGDTALPAAAAALPTEKRLALGIRLLPDGLLGAKGTGAGVYGYYRDGEARWRVLSIIKADADQAGDVLATLRTIPGASKEKGIADGAIRLMLEPPGGAKTEWLVAKKGNRLLGVGDEDRVLRPGMTADEHRSKTLDQEQKRALLKKLLEAG